MPDQAIVSSEGYSDADVAAGARAYCEAGGMEKASEALSVDLSDFRRMTRQSGWRDAVRRVRAELDDRMIAQQTLIACKAGEVTLDRLEHGDKIVGRDGFSMMQPIKGRDAAVIGGIAADKLKDATGRAVTVDDVNVAAKILALAGQFAAIARGAATIKDVTPVSGVGLPTTIEHTASEPEPDPLEGVSL